MKKKVGIIKRLFTLLLIFLLSINSFGGIVSDNDGSAFITKAEFDALKSSFQSQINNYNQSIDSKIDGAIASYLAGIRIANTVHLENFYNQYVVSGANGLAWSGLTTYSCNSASSSPVSESIAFQSFSAYGVAQNLAAMNIAPTNIAPYAWYGIYEKSQTKAKRCICNSVEGKIDKIQNFEMILSGTQFAYEGQNTYASNYTIGGNATGAAVYTNILGKITKRTNYSIVFDVQPSSGYPRGYVPALIYNEILSDLTEPFVLAPLSTATDYFDFTPADISFSNTSTQKHMTQDQFKVIGSWWSDLETNLSRNSMTDYFWGSAAKRNFPYNIAYNNYIVNSFINICPKNNNMKCGIALTEIDKNYKKVTVNMTPSDSGFLIVYEASDASEDWAGKKSSYTTNPIYTVSAGVPKTFIFDTPAKDNYLFVVYLPSGSAIGTLTNVEIIGELDA